MKIIKKYPILILLVLTITSVDAVSQNLPEAGSIGLRASFFGQSSIEVPYMLNESVSLAPALGFSSVENSTTNIQIGVRPRFYMQTIGTLLPYVSGNLTIDIQSNKITDTSTTDILLGVGYGGEYFFSESFSLSAEGGLNLRTGDNSTSFGTGARVSASVYF